jgi:hypothetical protein
MSTTAIASRRIYLSAIKRPVGWLIPAEALDRFFAELAADARGGDRAETPPLKHTRESYTPGQAAQAFGGHPSKYVRWCKYGCARTAASAPPIDDAEHAAADAALQVAGF